MVESIIPSNEKQQQESVFREVKKVKPKIRRYDIIFGCILFCASCALFFAVEQAINGLTWFAPIVASLIWFSCLSVFSVSAVHKSFVRWVVFFSVIPSIFFALTLFHVAIVTLVGALLSRAMTQTRRAMFNARKLRIIPALKLYGGTVVLALSLVITSQFYQHIAERPAGSFVPQLSGLYGIDQALAGFLGGPDATVDDFLRSQISPASADSASGEVDDGATVDLADGFAAKFFRDAGLDPSAIGSYGAESLSAINEIIGEGSQAQELALTSLRSRLSETTGQELSGSERIIDVLGHTLDVQTQSFLAKNQVIARTISEVMALLLLISLISLGSLLKHFWSLGAHVLFVFLRSRKIIRVTTVKRDVEALQL